MSRKKSMLNATLKSKDTEEFLDILFYRPVGLIMALGFKTLRFSPNAVTIISIFVGAAAGYFFYTDKMSLNLIGILLLIIAEAMDSADGQLARITNTKSRFGRILDGFGGNIWFISIYLFLGFRLMNEGMSGWIFLLIVLCGVSHSLQSAMADYYRNFYLLFVFGKDKSEVDNSKDLKKQYAELSWSGKFFEKLFMRLYLNYTIEQEFFSKSLRRLYNKTIQKFGPTVPGWFSTEYRALNKSNVKYYNILTTNTRMVVLFISIILKQPLIYFFFEITILNLILIYTVLKQEKNSIDLHTVVSEVGN